MSFFEKEVTELYNRTEAVGGVAMLADGVYNGEVGTAEMKQTDRSPVPYLSIKIDAEAFAGSAFLSLFFSGSDFDKTKQAMGRAKATLQKLGFDGLLENFNPEFLIGKKVKFMVKTKGEYRNVTILEKL
jgi:hypothetical protein